MVRRPPDPRPFVHLPTKTLDTRAILKREDPSDWRQARQTKKKKRSQFRATRLQSIGYSRFLAGFDGSRTRERRRNSRQAGQTGRLSYQATSILRSRILFPVGPVITRSSSFSKKW